MTIESIEASDAKLSGFEQIVSAPRHKQVAYIFIALLIAYVILRGLRGAAARPFWCDELLTVTVAGQATLHGMWTAVMRGFDTQAPGFYLVERFASKLPVSREIAFRLPSILAFACTVLCVFNYVRKRGGELVACLCAVLLLSTSLFERYSIEARGYSLMTACIALALLCYQRLPSLRWVTLLAISLFLAESFHYYAVFAVIPFGLAEAMMMIKTRQVRWSVWLALVSGALPLIFFWHLLSTIKTYYGAHVYSRPVLARIPEYYGSYFLIPDVFGIGLVVISIVAVVWLYVRSQELPRDPVGGTGQDLAELTLFLSLNILPLIAYVLIRVMHGALLDRYVLATAVGIVLAIGCLLSILEPKTVAFFSLLVLSSIGVRELRFWHHSGGDPRVRDFSVRAWGEFGEIRKFVQSVGHPDLPVVFAQGPVYSQVVYYCPPDWTRRLVYLTDASKELKYVGTDSSIKTVEGLGEFFPLQLVDYTKFTSEHSEFLMYSEPSEWSLFALRDEGAEVQVLKVDGNRWLYLVKMKSNSAQ